MPIRKTSSTVSRSRKASTLQRTEKASRVPSRDLNTPRENVSDRKEMLERYKVFLHELEVQEEKARQDYQKDLAKLKELEEEAVRLAWSRYTEEQLNMTIPQFEAHLRQTKADEKENQRKNLKTDVETKVTAVAVTSTLSITVTAEGTAETWETESASLSTDNIRLKIPRGVRGSSRKPGSHRRPSFANKFSQRSPQGFSTPRFLSSGTGIKSVKPRMPKLGERIYGFSEQGTPLIMPTVTQEEFV